MTLLSAKQIAYLDDQTLGRIATVGRDGRPHVVPTGFDYNAALDTVDVFGIDVGNTKKFRDVRATGHAAIVIDDSASPDQWSPRMLEIRGRAEAIDAGGSGLGPGGMSEAFIRIHVEKVACFGVDEPARLPA